MVLIFKPKGCIILVIIVAALGVIVVILIIIIWLKCSGRLKVPLKKNRYSSDDRGVVSVVMDGVQNCNTGNVEYSYPVLPGKCKVPNIHGEKHQVNKLQRLKHRQQLQQQQLQQ